MAPPQKLTDEQVRKIRQRVARGEQQTALAVEYGVNRKTLRRRLDALERIERERAERRALRRRAHQVAAERKKLKTLFEPQATPALDHHVRVEPLPHASKPLPPADPHQEYQEWLDTPKNLTGPALSAAMGLVRIQSPDGAVPKIIKSVDKAEAEAYLEQGWTLAPRQPRPRR